MSAAGGTGRAAVAVEAAVAAVAAADAARANDLRKPLRHERVKLRQILIDLWGSCSMNAAHNRDLVFIRS